jgi:hypothetical protein
MVILPASAQRCLLRLAHTPQSKPGRLHITPREILLAPPIHDICHRPFFWIDEASEASRESTETLSGGVCGGGAFALARQATERYEPLFSQHETSALSK